MVGGNLLTDLQNLLVSNVSIFTIEVPRNLFSYFATKIKDNSLVSVDSGSKLFAIKDFNTFVIELFAI